MTRAMAPKSAAVTSWKLSKKDEADVRSKVDDARRGWQEAGLLEEEIDEKTNELKQALIRSIKEEKARKCEERKKGTGASASADETSAAPAVVEPAPRVRQVGKGPQVPGPVPLARPPGRAGVNSDYLVKVDKAVQSILQHAAFQDVKSRDPIAIAVGKEQEQSGIQASRADVVRACFSHALCSHARRVLKDCCNF